MVSADDSDRPDRPEDGGAMAGAATALDELRRWEAAGGGWHVVALGAAGGKVMLERCDLGEPVGEIASADPDFVAHLRRHGAS